MTTSSREMARDSAKDSRPAQRRGMSELECTPVEVSREERDGEEWNLVTMRKANDGSKVRITYREVADVGKGTFGTVRKVVTIEGSTFALKRLDHDPRCHIDNSLSYETEFLSLVKSKIQCLYDHI